MKSYAEVAGAQGRTLGWTLLEDGSWDSGRQTSRGGRETLFKLSRVAFASVWSRLLPQNASFK